MQLSAEKVEKEDDIFFTNFVFVFYFFCRALYFLFTNVVFVSTFFANHCIFFYKCRLRFLLFSLDHCIFNKYRLCFPFLLRTTKFLFINDVFVFHFFSADHVGRIYMIFSYIYNSFNVITTGQKLTRIIF